MQLSTLHRMTTVDEVEATVGRPPSMIMLKQISALDEGCRSVLAHCPLAGFGYRDADGVSGAEFRNHQSVWHAEHQRHKDQQQQSHTRSGAGDRGFDSGRSTGNSAKEGADQGKHADRTLP